MDHRKKDARATPCGGENPAGESDAIGPVSSRDLLSRFVEDHLQSFLALVKRVLSEEDRDAVHDVRVSSRRLQQCLDGMYPTVRPRRVRELRRTLGRVRHALGEWRNCDVILESIDRRRRRDDRKHAVDDLVRRHAERERRRAIRRARRRLRRHDLARFATRFRKVVGRLWSNAEIRASLSTGVARAWAEWQAALAAAEAERDLAAVHELRIATKGLRYLIEVAVECGESGGRPLLAWLKEIQDVVGRWHDRQVLYALTGDAVDQRKKTGAKRSAVDAALHGMERARRRDALLLAEIFRLARRPEGGTLLREWLDERIPKRGSRS